MGISVEYIDSIMVITIERPAVRNAVDRETASELAQAFRKFDEEERYSVAVLTGAEGNFCAGADLKAIANGKGNTVSIEGDGPMGPTRMFLRKPVIAAIEGYAVAGGLELACWCDLRVASETAIFGVYCRRFGVPLVDGGTIRLPRLIGMSQAMDMILTGRSVTAQEGFQMGLVNRLVSSGTALERAIQLAADIAKFPQACLRNDRASSYQQWDLSVSDALVQETKLGLDTIHSGETVLGAKNFASGKGRRGEDI